MTGFPPPTLALAAAISLFVLGAAGMMLRRSILVVVMSGALAVLGVALALASVAAARLDGRPAALALLVLLFCAAWSLLGAAVAITTYRRRGTENIDELRELR